MTASEKSLELVIIGCGEIYQALSAESAIYAKDQERLRCISLPGPAAIADEADSLLATLDPGRHQLFIAIEANALNHARLELYGRARLRGFRMSTMVHPTAYVSPSASLGDNVWVGPGAHVAAGCKVGSNTLIGVHSRLDLNAMIGTHVWIGAGCSIGSGSRIGNHCVLGTDVKLCAGTRLGKYSLLEQPGPWSGEISAGTFAVNNYAEPAKVIGAGYTHSLRA
jgi:acetyltransferase-like isoleucine patch superfamily enzyme